MPTRRVSKFATEMCTFESEYTRVHLLMCWCMGYRTHTQVVIAVDRTLELWQLPTHHDASARLVTGTPGVPCVYLSRDVFLNDIVG